MFIKEFTMTVSDSTQEGVKQIQKFDILEATVEAPLKTLSQILAKNVHRYVQSDIPLSHSTLFDQMFQGEDLEAYEQAMEEFVRQFTFQELIGVQPITAPVGKIFYLKYNKEGERLILNVKDAVVEACTSKYSSKWNVEAKLDLSATVPELRQALFSEMALELTNRLYEDLHHIATGYHRLSHEDDKFTENLIVSINRASSAIGVKTRRGKANWMVCSPITFALLKEAIKAKGIKWEPQESEETGGPTPLIFCGTMPDHGIRVYTYIHAKDNTLLLGYKGNNGEIDTGMVWSPFIPIMSSGIIVDPLTFVPCVGFMERSARSFQTNAGDYYSVIEIDDLDFRSDDETVEDDSSYSEDVKSFLKTFKSTPYVRKDVREGESRLLNWPQNKRGIYGLVTDSNGEPLSLFVYNLCGTRIKQMPFVNPSTFEPTIEPAVLVGVRIRRVSNDPSLWEADENIYIPLEVLGLTEEDEEWIMKRPLVAKRQPLDD